MSSGERRLVASPEALQAYLEDLFGRPPESSARETGPGPEETGGPGVVVDPLSVHDRTGDSDADRQDESDSGESVYYLFDVAGLTLAIPEVRFESEIPLPEVITPPLGETWRRIAETSSGPLVVVDTERLILPESAGDFPDQRVSHLIVLDSGNWALAAHGAGVREKIDLFRVHWRSTSGRRDWLAGTLPERRCVLLELDAIARQAL
jgi:purine-binding chemotaxis protein CheW